MTPLKDEESCGKNSLTDNYLQQVVPYFYAHML